MFELLGYIGMVATLASVISANSKGKFRSWYNVLIIVGGICLTLNAAYIKSIPFFVLNVTWTILGAWGFYRERRGK